MARPAVLPRDQMTPLGELLAKRDISPRALGEAIAIAERRDQRVPTQLVNRWIWNRAQPGERRRQIIAEILKVPVNDLFSPKPRKPRKRPPTAGEQAMLDAASQYDDEPDVHAASRHLIRAVAQETIPGASEGDLACIIERKSARRARRQRADDAQADRRAA